VPASTALLPLSTSGSSVSPKPNIPG
jgi:hypothetical protein